MKSNPAVLVTGAAGGIGTATVLDLASRSYLVYAGLRRAGSAPQFDGADDIRTVQLDVTDPDSVAAAAARIADERGDLGLQAVVNNAGVIVQGPLELVPDAELHRQFDVNVFGAARVIGALLPALRTGGGRIVNISAPTAHIAPPLLAPIASSKAALNSISDAFRVELAAWRIPVSIVEPGLTDTAIFAKAAAAAEAALAAMSTERVALYRAHLDAFERASAKQKPAPVKPTSDTIVKAVTARRPKPRYVVGMQAKVMTRLLPRLSLRTRDRMLARTFGLAKITAPQQRDVAAGRSR